MGIDEDCCQKDQDSLADYSGDIVDLELESEEGVEGEEEIENEWVV